MTIEEGNKLIASFDGKKRDADAPWWRGFDYIHHGYASMHEANLQYHYSWSWLMPAVEKIEILSTEFDGYFGVHIFSNGCTIQGTRFNPSIENPNYAYFNDVTLSTKIESTWYAVVQFIQWWNQNKQL